MGRGRLRPRIRLRFRCHFRIRARFRPDLQRQPSAQPERSSTAPSVRIRRDRHEMAATLLLAPRFPIWPNSNSAVFSPASWRQAGSVRKHSRSAVWLADSSRRAVARRHDEAGETPAQQLQRLLRQLPGQASANPKPCLAPAGAFLRLYRRYRGRGPAPPAARGSARNGRSAGSSVRLLSGRASAPNTPRGFRDRGRRQPLNRARLPERQGSAAAVRKLVCPGPGFCPVIARNYSPPSLRTLKTSNLARGFFRACNVRLAILFSRGLRLQVNGQIERPFAAGTFQ